MFRKAVLLALAGAAATLGQSTWDDTSLQQYLLTLKNVENAFFTQGLDQFSADDFANWGYDAWVRNRLTQIAAHESTQVNRLTDALGSDAPAACDYTFDITDVGTFIDIAQRITTVEASAGIGAVGLLSDTDVKVSTAALTAAESRHAAWITASIQKRQPWDGAYEAALSPDAAYSLLSTYIGNCPDSNPEIPIHSYPALDVYPGDPTAGDIVYVSLLLKALKAPSKTFYLAWLDGLDVQYSPIENGQATVPEGLDGTLYVAVVSSQDPPSAKNLVSGYAVVQFPFNSKHTESN
ncbi:ferritin-like domain-containing protein [Trametes maxima]|nr:ferritin-like domain-containing protein [Trametes maxima]